MSEKGLDLLMEECLQTKAYTVMVRSLEVCRTSYSKYESYTAKLKEVMGEVKWQKAISLLRE